MDGKGPFRKLSPQGKLSSGPTTSLQKGLFFINYSMGGGKLASPLLGELRSSLKKQTVWEEATRGEVSQAPPQEVCVLYCLGVALEYLQSRGGSLHEGGVESLKRISCGVLKREGRSHA